MTNYMTPRPMSKSEVREDFAEYETRYKDQSRTLSQFAANQIVNMWDCESLTDSELLVLVENTRKKSLVSLVILELKN